MEAAAGGGGGGGSSSRSWRGRWVEVVVEVVRAENLMPKDGEGSASAFVEVVLDGQRKKTMVRAKDLNPVWNQQLLFHVALLRYSSVTEIVDDDVDDFQLDVNVYSANNAGKTLIRSPSDAPPAIIHDVDIYSRRLGRRSTSISFLGRVRIPGSAAFVSEPQASVRAYSLHKRSFFSHVRGRLYLRVFCRPTSSYCPPNNILALHVPPPASTSSSPPDAVAATSLQKQLSRNDLEKRTSSDLDTISTSASIVDGDSDSNSSFSSSSPRPETAVHALSTSTHLLHSPPPQSANYHAQPSVMSSTAPFTKEVMNLSHPSSAASINYGLPAASELGCFYSRSYTAASAGSNNSIYDYKPKETRPRLAATAKRNLLPAAASSGIGMHMLLQQQQQSDCGGGSSTSTDLASTLDAGGMSLVAGSNYDLVERMEYLYVKVVRAKGLRPKDISMASASSGVVDAYVLLKIGSVIATTRVVQGSLNPEWNEVFAFSKDKSQAPLLELMVKDRHPDHTPIVPTTSADVVGYVAFDLAEVPVRVPPDSALAPQWYKLEKRKPAGRNSKNGVDSSLNQYAAGYFQSDVGEIMVSVWKGTQADEAFAEASWHSDAGGMANQTLARSKVYMSPRLWYLRVHIIEAQDLLLLARLPPKNSSTPAAADAGSNSSSTTTTAAGASISSSSIRVPEIRVRVQLGFQVATTRAAVRSSSGGATNWSNPIWNEDLLFVAAEPFEDPLIITVEDRVASGKDQVVGKTLISIASVERRTDRRHVNPRWYNLFEKVGHPANAGISSSSSSRAFMSSRVHVRMCLEGGYHVLDESTQFCSDMRPSSRSLWPAPVGVLQLGILRATGLLPTKSRDRMRGTTDAYVVAKYGPKWVRSRTVVDSFSPSWNEQYTWEVYDPCTVLTVAVFDNASCGSSAVDDPKSHHHHQTKSNNKHIPADTTLGKVRIRLSTLDSGRVYAHSYPLLLLQTSGVKKMGELELSVRFSAVSAVSLLSCYGRPLLPKMHYVRPLSVAQVDALRKNAVRIIAARLARAEPPVKPEVVQWMLVAMDGGHGSGSSSTSWSMRKSKANWMRVAGLMSGAVMGARWMWGVREWRNPMTTVLVHVLILMLVCFPDLILPTLFLYLFLVGAWHYRWRPRQPLHVDLGISQLLLSSSSGSASSGWRDELEEEMESCSSVAPISEYCKSNVDVLRARYDRLRAVAARVQGVLGDVATQGERVSALLSWRDPRATALFLLFCLFASVLLYLLPFRPLALAFSFFLLRHPRLRRAHVPSLPINFFRRLPALSDHIL